MASEHAVARGLGWFSLGLGAAELVAPRTIARIVGSRNHTKLIRIFGLREIAAGAGLLAAARSAPWLWARFAGDLLDIASVGSVLRNGKKGRGKAIFSLASLAGVTALDAYYAKRMSGNGRMWTHAEASIAVDRPPEECYRFWRNLENVPSFMSYIKSVQTTDDRLSHWVAGTDGAVIEWNSEIVRETPDRRFAWRTTSGSDVWHSGSVDFEPVPAGRGTIVRLHMDYGKAFRSLQPIAKLIGKAPDQVLSKELRRFKQVMETGEVITTEGQPAGRGSGATWLDKIAR